MRPTACCLAGVPAPQDRVHGIWGLADAILAKAANRAKLILDDALTQLRRGAGHRIDPRRAAEPPPSDRPAYAPTDPALVSALIYELLDAHADTVHLAQEQPGVMTVHGWADHIAYLQALGRKGRETLAHLPATAVP